MFSLAYQNIKWNSVEGVKNPYNDRVACEPLTSKKPQQQHKPEQSNFNGISKISSSQWPPCPTPTPTPTATDTDPKSKTSFIRTRLRLAQVVSTKYARVFFKKLHKLQKKKHKKKKSLKKTFAKMENKAKTKPENKANSFCVCSTLCRARFISSAVGETVVVGRCRGGIEGYTAHIYLHIYGNWLSNLLKFGCTLKFALLCSLLA